MKNALVLQSGGPTAAINATLAGVVERALISQQVDKIYGAIYGIKGVIENNLIEIGQRLSSAREMSLLTQTPAAALGSARHKLPELGTNNGEYETIFKVLKENNIGYMVCIGGNDSMDTVAKLSTYARENKIKDIAIMGAPKTIDNDLCGMDHSPGFASAARYVATTFAELWCDCRVYDIPAVTIVEIMGRGAGWLAASASLANVYGEAPHLIYLPEITFDNERFLSDIKEKLEENHAIMIAVSEGIKYADGTFVGEANQYSATDAFGHKILAGAAKVLEEIIRDEVGCKCRSVELNLMQRSAGHLTSSVDLQESRMLGSTAMDRALSGESGQVSILTRTSDAPYRIKYETIPVEVVANKEKMIPREWINEMGNHVKPEMIKYLAPLIADDKEEKTRRGLPKHLRFY